ncbi:TMEM165/GDT1 family protein [Streptomyces radicis]|uniref:GDT1 family protein n=1 Tax=Streptomyces radicis TaxID=1750517 RepID=A0A3A9WGZ0_9ACTN|nr:TMEM165/GDT1 family protein [Streptomyces radicis]RKN12080.1 TMEM165/GDT1 family protein [Streptomyces radicis]RKN25868.1 TMEM165/GDT1 family protein [Streptomyces radicis]
MSSLTVAAVSFGVIALSELPDKTALASLVLATRYRAAYVFAGVAAAFLVHVCVAVAAGSLLRLLPRRPLEAVVAVLFVVGALLLLRQSRGAEGRAEGESAPEREPGSRSFRRGAGGGFTLVLVAEFGDLSQILTANLAARYHDPLAVGVGAVLALWTVAGVAVLGGRALVQRVPLRLISRVAAVVMLVLAAISLVRAIRG